MKNLLVILMLSVGAFAQNNTIHILGGTAHNEKIGEIVAGSPTVMLDYEHSFSSKWNLETTFMYSADRSKNTGRGSTALILPMLEYYITPKVFIGGGVQISRNVTPEYRSQISVNPTFEAGLDLPIKKAVIEPYIQGATPDMHLKSRMGNIGVGINYFRNINKNVGIRVNGYAFENYWKGGQGLSTGLLAGIYFKF